MQQIERVILSALGEKFSNIITAHDNLIQAFAFLSDRFTQFFPISENIDIYFYIGLCNGAGWVTKIGQTHSVLLGAEKIVELGWHNKDKLSGLLYHELGHVAHSILREESISKNYGSSRDRSFWQLYVEGFANYCEELLIGIETFHKGEEWLDWCKENHQLLCREYLSRLEANQPTQDFFGDWNTFQGCSDTGYYLGWCFIKSLPISLFDIASMQLDEISKQLYRYLRQNVEE